MSNDTFYCETILRHVTPATCKLRLEGGWCSLDKCFIKKQKKEVSVVNKENSQENGVSTRDDLHFNEVTITKKKRKKDKRDRSDRTKPRCKHEGCKRLQWKKGYCYKHYFKVFPDAKKPTQYHSEKFKKAIKASGNGDKTIIERLEAAIKEREDQITRLAIAVQAIKSVGGI